MMIWFCEVEFVLCFFIGLITIYSGKEEQNKSLQNFGYVCLIISIFLFAIYIVDI